MFCFTPSWIYLLSSCLGGTQNKYDYGWIQDSLVLLMLLTLQYSINDKRGNPGGILSKNVVIVSLPHHPPAFFFSGDFVKNCVLQWRNYTDEQEGVEQGPGRLWRRTACYILSLSAFSLMTHPICIPRFGRLVILFIFSFPSLGTTNFNGPSSWLSFRALLWIKFTREDVGGGEVFLTDIKEIKFIWESIESRETPEVINNNEETTPIRKTAPSASTGNHFEVKNIIIIIIIIFINSTSPSRLSAIEIHWRVKRFKF